MTISFHRNSSLRAFSPASDFTHDTRKGVQPQLHIEDSPTSSSWVTQSGLLKMRRSALEGKRQCFSIFYDVNVHAHKLRN